MPILLGRGGVLMTLPEPAATAAPVVTASAAPVPVYGRGRWWEGAVGALLLFLGGAARGAAALFGGQTVYRQADARARLAAPPLRLTDQSAPLPHQAPTAEGDPTLIIPRFDERG